MENLSAGLEVTLIGMGVVFTVLYVLSVILKLFRYFFYKEEDGKVSRETINSLDSEVQDEEQLAIVCAVMAKLLNEREYIVNIKKVK